MNAFDAHRHINLVAEQIWNHAAETARKAGDLSLAYDCSQRAIRCQYLGERGGYATADIERLESAFNRADLELNFKPPAP